jgi:hypothetical protein
MVFQAKLCGIVVDWILNQWKKTSPYAINVDSKAPSPITILLIL